MMVHAPISPFYPQRPRLYLYELPIHPTNMTNEPSGGPQARRVYAASDASNSPRERGSPFAQPVSTAVPPEHVRPRQGSVTSAATPETVWAQGNFLPRDSYTPPSVYHWPQQYTGGNTASPDLTAMAGYPSGPPTDADSTSALDDLFFRQDMAQFQGRFDENLPLASLHTGAPPYLYEAGGSTAEVIPSVVASIQSVSPQMMMNVPATMVPRAVGPYRRGSQPMTPPSTAGLPEARAGSKRVREPSPLCASFGIDPAHKRLKLQATDTTTAAGGRASTPHSRNRTPDPRAGPSEPQRRKSVTPAAELESGRSTAGGGRARRASQSRGRDEARTPGACWRCRRYKKPCNNREGTCDTCLTSGFRIWPPSLGCRRGDIQEFVNAIMPDGMEDAIDNLPRDMPGARTWRMTLEAPVQQMPAELEGRVPDKWDHLCEKVVSTRIYGQEFVELFEILAKHQRGANKEHPLLNLIAATLSYSVDLYHRFVLVGEHGQPEPKANTARENVTALRQSLSKNLSAWLSLCLRGQLADFPIAYLVASLTLCSLLIFSDTVAALKVQTGEMVWTNSAREQMMTLRTELLTIGIDLLGVVAKGSKPLKFRCFQHSPGEPRSQEGMRLMGENKHTFDIMAGLQQWIVRHRAVFATDAWGEVPSFTPGVRPIQAMSRFIRMGYGELGEA